MLFGLNEVPASFQRYINKTLREYLDDFCSAYAEYILVYIDGNLSDHENHVKLVLTKPQKASLGLVIHKYEFSLKKTKYLGYVISAEGSVSSMRMDQAKENEIS